MKVIKTIKEANKLKFGDQYIIDVLPEDPTQATQKDYDKEEKIQMAIEELGLVPKSKK